MSHPEDVDCLLRSYDTALEWLSCWSELTTLLCDNVAIRKGSNEGVKRILRKVKKVDRLTHRSIEGDNLARFDRSGNGTPLSTILEMIASGGRFLRISFDGQREGKSKYLDFLRSVKVAVWAVVLAVRYEVELLDHLETVCFIQGLSG